MLHFCETGEWDRYVFQTIATFKKMRWGAVTCQSRRKDPAFEMRECVCVRNYDTKCCLNSIVDDRIAIARLDVKFDGIGAWKSERIQYETDGLTHAIFEGQIQHLDTCHIEDVPGRRTTEVLEIACPQREFLKDGTRRKELAELVDRCEIHCVNNACILQN